MSLIRDGCGFCQSFELLSNLFVVSQLRKAGTFAGNDALVAFSRLHDVTIVIHQLDSAYFSIGDCTSRELHLTYHNGEHYSSVRRIGDRSANPAHIKFKVSYADLSHDVA